MRKPTQVNILGCTYKIEYVDKPSEVDVFKRDSLWGQCDYWTRTIRVYETSRPIEDIWNTIIHETLHAICNALKLDDINKDEKMISLLATGLADTFIRNGWFVVDDN